MLDSRTSKTVPATLHNRLGFEKHAGSAGERKRYENLFCLFIFLLTKKQQEGGKKIRLKGETLLHSLTAVLILLSLQTEKMKQQALRPMLTVFPACTRRKMMNPNNIK